MEETENKTSEVALGTLYDMNKTIIEKQQTLPEGVINSKKEELKNFLRKINNNYYLLLCKEIGDYTIFTLGNNTDIDKEDKYTCFVNVLVDECLYNRGDVKAFDITPDKQAIEIWISTNNESFAYYFIPYDSAIIDIETEMEAK